MDRFNGLDVPESLEDALDARTLAFVIYDVWADPLWTAALTGIQS
jgi:hypothetical protein